MSNLLTTVEQIKTAIYQSEHTQASVARLIRKIHREELWKQSDSPTFAEYLKNLIEITKQVGWGSVRSIRNYIKLWAVYVEELELPEEHVLGAVSHFGALLTVANTNTQLQLKGETENGKLGEWDFSRLAETIYLASTGALSLNPENHKTHLRIFKELVGVDFWNPIGGWKVADTEEVVARIRGVEEKAEPTFTKAWLTQELDEDLIAVIGVCLVNQGVPGRAALFQEEDWGLFNPVELKKFLGKDEQISADGDEDDDDL